MRIAKLTTSDGRVVCERCSIAESAFSRMRGLLGRSALEAGEGILLRPAGSIHTAFMRFPIDAVFLDRDLVVLKVVADLPPWRAARCAGARAVVELRAGESERRGIRPGEHLTLTDAAKKDTP